MVQLKTPRYGRLKSLWIALIDPVEDSSDQCGFGYRLPHPILFPKVHISAWDKPEVGPIPPIRLYTEFLLSAVSHKTGGSYQPCRPRS